MTEIYNQSGSTHVIVAQAITVAAILKKALLLGANQEGSVISILNSCYTGAGSAIAAEAFTISRHESVSGTPKFLVVIPYAAFGGDLSKFLTFAVYIEI